MAAVSTLAFVAITNSHHFGFAADASASNNAQSNSTSGTSTAQLSSPSGSSSVAFVGQISNVQLDNGSKPAWIQSGIWLLRGMMNGSTPQVNQLYVRFTMMKPDGTAMHTHLVYNFQQSNGASQQGGVESINGTATVTMPAGPVSGVPVSINVFNQKLIAIWIGPDKVNSHFGTNPIYGTVTKPILGAMSELSSIGSTANTTIMTSANKNFTIALDSNPSTGYSWRVKTIDNSLTNLVNDTYLAPSSKLLGAPGKEIITFQALKQGHTTIVLQYIRPSDLNHPAATYSIELAIGP